MHGNMVLNVGGLNQDTKGSVMTYVQGSSYLTVTERVVVLAEQWTTPRTRRRSG